MSVDELSAEGRVLGPLHDISIAIKDLFDFRAALAASRVVEVMQPWIATYPQRVTA